MTRQKKTPDHQVGGKKVLEFVFDQSESFSLASPTPFCTLPSA